MFPAEVEDEFTTKHPSEQRHDLRVRTGRRLRNQAGYLDFFSCTTMKKMGQQKQASIINWGRGETAREGLQLAVAAAAVTAAAVGVVTDRSSEEGTHKHPHKRSPPERLPAGERFRFPPLLCQSMFLASVRFSSSLVNLSTSRM